MRGHVHPEDQTVYSVSYCFTKGIHSGCSAYRRTVNLHVRAFVRLNILHVQ